MFNLICKNCGSIFQPARRCGSCEIIVMCSGYFDGIHRGHILYLEAAKRLGDKLGVIINNDRQCLLKKNYFFQNEIERKFIIDSLRVVDFSVISIDEDLSVCKTLEKWRPDIFANGGDVLDCRERKICELHNIECKYGVGGYEKINSSSDLIKRIRSLKI